MKSRINFDGVSYPCVRWSSIDHGDRISVTMEIPESWTAEFVYGLMDGDRVVSIKCKQWFGDKCKQWSGDYFIDATVTIGESKRVLQFDGLRASRFGQYYRLLKEARLSEHFPTK